MSTTLEQPPIQGPSPTPPHRRRSLIVIILAVVAVVAAATVMTVFALSGKDESQPTSTPQPTAAPNTTVPTTAPSTTSRAQPSTGGVTVFGYQPLWPFANQAEVKVWQDGYRSGGHQPWALDADATALAFTTGYLGFTNVNVVVSHSITGDEALVTVGYPIEHHAPGTAAVLHLAKYGTGDYVPWEVVGSKDTTLTLTQPAYGTTVRSPVKVGGRITGVDENLRVQVRQPSSEQPIGEAPGLPAGGQNTPWSTTVTFTGATAPALTIVAFTGGHYTDVERFAITAVRPGVNG